MIDDRRNGVNRLGFLLILSGFLIGFLHGYIHAEDTDRLYNISTLGRAHSPDGLAPDKKGNRRTRPLTGICPRTGMKKTERIHTGL